MKTQLVLQKYLKGGGTLEALAETYAVKVVRHKTYPNLILFKYNQIASDMNLPIVQECQGVILDEADDWRVVGRAYSKFINYGEPNAAEIDWVTARVQEKVDGSLCMAFEYKGSWHVATTGSPDAGGPVGDNSEMTFAALPGSPQTGAIRLSCRAKVCAGQKQKSVSPSG